MVKSLNKYNRISKLFKEDSGGTSLVSTLESSIVVYEQEQSEKNPKIPLHIFSENKLGILEAATKYLKENHSMKYCEIAKFLNRDDRTVRASYINALKKKESKFEIDEIKYSIPCDVFSNRKLGPLESLVVYLKDNLNLSIGEISKQLNRTYMVVYLSYTNGKKK
jgi:hypothetical protein